MSNLIVVSGAAMLYRDGSVTPEPLVAVASHNITQNGNGISSGPQLIGTSATNLNLDNVTTIGYCTFENLDADNYVEIGYTDGAWIPVLKLMPSTKYIGCPLAPTPGRVYQGKANTAACLINYKVCDA